MTTLVVKKKPKSRWLVNQWTRLWRSRGAGGRADGRDLFGEVCRVGGAVGAGDAVAALGSGRLPTTPESTASDGGSVGDDNRPSFVAFRSAP